MISVAIIAFLLVCGVIIFIVWFYTVIHKLSFRPFLSLQCSCSSTVINFKDVKKKVYLILWPWMSASKKLLLPEILGVTLAIISYLLGSRATPISAQTSRHDRDDMIFHKGQTYNNSICVSSRSAKPRAQLVLLFCILLIFSIKQTRVTLTGLYTKIPNIDIQINK